MRDPEHHPLSRRLGVPLALRRIWSCATRLLCCLARYELFIVNEEGTPGCRRLPPDRSFAWTVHALSGKGPLACKSERIH